MASHLKDTVIAGYAPKEAALYFRHIIPILGTDFLDKDNMTGAMIIPAPKVDRMGAPYLEAIMKEILPENMSPRNESPKAQALYATYLDILLEAGRLAQKMIDVGDELLFRRQWPFESEPLGRLYADFLDRLGPVSLIEKSVRPGIDNGDSPALTLMNLRLVDAEKISWEKLKELRRDEEAIKAFRRLRLFLTEEFPEKDQEFVKDDLEQRIDDHNDHVKAWELDTRDAQISVILSSKTMLATSGALGAALLIGGPISTALLAGAATKLVVDLCNVRLVVNKRKRDLGIFKKQDPMTYLVEARKLSDEAKLST